MWFRRVFSTLAKRRLEWEHEKKQERRPLGANTRDQEKHREVKRQDRKKWLPGAHK